MKEKSLKKIALQLYAIDQTNKTDNEKQNEMNSLIEKLTIEEMLWIDDYLQTKFYHKKKNF